MLDSMFVFVQGHLKEIIWGLGVVVAALSVWNFRDIAKKKEALNMLMAQKQDDSLIKAILTISKRHIDPNYDIGQLGYEYKDLTAGQQKDRVAIAYALNHCEYVAVGIHRKTYHEKLVKDASYNTIINLYLQTEPFIQTLRQQKKTDTYFQEFEALAKRWKCKPLRKKKIKNNAD